MLNFSEIKTQVDRVLNDEKHSKIGRYFNLLMAYLIIANIFALILETVPAYNSRFHSYFHYFEYFSIFVFTIEYFLRLWVSPNKKQFVISPLSIIDLLTILPFYLPFVHVDFRFLRSLRLLRLLRIFKLARYSHALQTLIAVIVHKKHELAIAASFGILMLVVTSSGIYFFENPAQPDKFSSIPDAMWWSVVTLTTVGYGDIYPITLAGRILGGVTAFFGIGMFALPAGILASGFAQVIQNDTKIKSTRLLINIDVNDLSKATMFYCECFNLKLERSLGDKIVELSGLESPLFLLAKEESHMTFAGATTSRTYTRHWTPVHLDFVVPDIIKALDRARKAGAFIESEIKTQAWGKIALLSDPFGNGFCLIEFLGQGYDEITK